MSIEAQVAELEEYATKENLIITEFIIESKTAKEPGRDQFEKMLKLIEQKKADGILSWHPDRLARNSIDGGKIIYLLDTGKLLDLKFPSFWFENTPQGKFMLNIAFGQSKYYVDNLSENVKRGNRQKLRRGEWPNHAPFGYINDSKTKSILINNKKAPIIQKAFKMFLEEKYSFTDIRNFFTKHHLLTEKDNLIHSDKVKRILSDSFYYGVMKFCGEFYEGKHEPLISKKLFDKVQEIVKIKSRKRKDNLHDYPYRGFIKCGECGCFITAEKRTKYYKRTKRKAEYYYHHCTKKKGFCSQGHIRREKLEKQLKVILKKVSLSPFSAKMFRQCGEKDASEERLKYKDQINNHARQLEETNLKLERLLEAYLDKIITCDEYQNKKNSLILQKVTLTQELKVLEEKGNNWLEPFNEFVNNALTCGKIAAAKNNCHDLEIMAKTVGSNFFLKDRRLSAGGFSAGFNALFEQPDSKSANLPSLPLPLLLCSWDSDQ